MCPQDEFRGYFVCDKISHLAKDYPFRVIQATLISAMRGKGFTRGIGDRGSRAHSGGRRSIQLVGSHG